MRYSFNPFVAQLVGTDAATIFDCIGFWVDTNSANDRNYVDGRYWTFNSAKAYHKLFFYISPKKIQRALLALEDAGLIVSGEFNQSSYDRTKWYTLTDMGDTIYHEQNDSTKKTKWSGHNCPHEWTDLSSREDVGVQPIPDSIHTDINTNINNKESDKSDSSSHSRVTSDIQRVIDCWNGLSDVGICRVSRVSAGSNRYKNLRARLAEYGVDDVLSAPAHIRHAPWLLGNNKSGWMIDFDWFVRPNNFPKVLEGKYGKAPVSTGYPEGYDLGE